MHIGVLSDPNNFHTRKWVAALMAAGTRVTVFSFDESHHNEFPAITIEPPVGKPGAFGYQDYLLGGKRLWEALHREKVDLVNALNVTPFGVWAMQAGFRPLIVSALGADILEYPPDAKDHPHLFNRAWSNPQGIRGGGKGIIQSAKRMFHRSQVKKAMEFADWVTGDNGVLVECIREWFDIPTEKVSKLIWGLEPELFEVSETELAALRHKYAIPNDRQLILAPRGANATYQADIILDAFSLLDGKGMRDVHFMMMSAGYEVSEAVREKVLQMKENGIGITFIDHMVDRKEVYHLWALVDVFISAPVYDGYSAALAEGRYAGAIPVVNAIPGNLEVMKEGMHGFFVDPFTPENLANTLSASLDLDPHSKEKIKEANQDWISTHSLLEENTRKFLELARNLM